MTNPSLMKPSAQQTNENKGKVNNKPSMGNSKPASTSTRPGLTSNRQPVVIIKYILTSTNNNHFFSQNQKILSLNKSNMMSVCLPLSVLIRSC